MKKFKQECSFVIFPLSGPPKPKTKPTKSLNVKARLTKKLAFIKANLTK